VPSSIEIEAALRVIVVSDDGAGDPPIYLILQRGMHYHMTLSSGVFQFRGAWLDLRRDSCFSENVAEMARYAHVTMYNDAFTGAFYLFYE